MNVIPNSGLDEPWLINGWNTDDNTNRQYLLSLHDGASSQVFRGYVKSGASEPTVDGTTKAVAGRWYHVAFVYDRTNLLLYVDGRLEATNNIGAVTLNELTNGVHLGGSGFYQQFGLNGVLDDVRIYNRALSADEIKRLYNMGR